MIPKNMSLREYVERAAERKAKRKIKRHELAKAKDALKPFTVLLKQADTLFSLFIRMRDKWLFNGLCVICNIRPIEVCFHWITRAEMAIRFHPDNASGTCSGCNYREVRDRRFKTKEFFRSVHIGLIGEERRAAIEAMQGMFKMDRGELQSKITQIKSMIEGLNRG